MTERRYPDKLEIVPLTKPPNATIRVPGSKSITNRALVLAALTAKGYICTLRGALQSDDTEVMINALRNLGYRVLTEWPESTVCVTSGLDEPLIPAKEAQLFVAESGTTLRFLTATVSLGHGRFRLDGSPRMRQRPMADLLAALKQIGGNAVSEHGTGCAPIRVEAAGLRGGSVLVRGDSSSQFISAILLAAPFARNTVTIEPDGPLVSWPYVFMTAQMLKQWGFGASWGGFDIQGAADLSYTIQGRQGATLESLRKSAERSTVAMGLDPRNVWIREYEIEPDASAATYFLGAAAISRGCVTISELTRQSIQGDVGFAETLADMGCELESTREGIALEGGELYGIDVDMNAISDCVPTLAAVACFAEGTTTIHNVAHIRHKESDRIAAMATELRKVGAEVDEFPDGLRITPRPLHGAEIETYNDHRIAMSMALIGLKVPGIVIKNPGCVAKTYPGFWDDLEKLRQ
jgi:3-phosphoshikimate 1-carboxyvinyltransferase